MLRGVPPHDYDVATSATPDQARALFPRTLEVGAQFGDAAGFASPMFEGGSALAMTSGKFAAQVAAEAIAKNDTSARALSKYEKLWRKEFPDYHMIVSGKGA